MLTRCSRHFSTDIKGGQFRLDIDEWSLFPAFSTINGGVSISSVYSSPPNTPTAVCIVLQHDSITMNEYPCTSIYGKNISRVIDEERK